MIKQSQFRMNDLTCIQFMNGVEYREKLTAYLSSEPREGISDVCVVPPNVAAMHFLIPGTARKSDFKPYEIMNRSGLLRLHPSVIVGAQAVRDALKARFGREIGIFITSGFRSEHDQTRLAVTQGLGWTDQGGRVSRDSMHKYGAALDFYAWDWRESRRIDRGIVANTATTYFDYVKTYQNTQHIHADMRYTAGIRPAA